MDSKTKFPVVGSMLTFIGAAHTALGVVIWATKDQDIELSFWFTAFGVAGTALGVAVIEVERARGHVTAPILAATAVLAGFGLAFEPVSGFLTVLVPLAAGVGGWIRRRNIVTAVA
ncbi:DUF6463 family protein [Nocardia donostiensis]|uniref:Uncharacterized protein n=1 Tax=Nocardia donostiensis TaxID=1538463 RepID=A0A1W0BCS1_9NOCA|nr:DUF6463 family protein [Nocardia donostiensis]ONM48072.1 hypothetical protein B0T46_13700 [Nocardia donostiensis]OQS20303.1 hypothetical protein B0T44_10360 [Nocardia donostiensis]